MKKYENQIPTTMNMNLKIFISMIRDFVTKGDNRRPLLPISAVKFPPSDTNLINNNHKVTWFGHSSFLLEINGIKLLFDPMFSLRPSPVQWIGMKRYKCNPSLHIEDFSNIDAIIISHDHYDHMDYHSIRKLHNKVSRFIVPLGLRKRLVEWGIPSEKITEHAWWDELKYKDITLVCAPARHFSGRGLFDRNTTLWSSWVIISNKTRVYYSGDSGYGPHFKEIGQKYGPFDLTLLECGQYDDRWPDIHMKPEETVQAHIDLEGRVMIPVHWGAFTLAFHPWTDPVERATLASSKYQASMSTPRIGEALIIDSKEFDTNPWWRHDDV